MIITRINTIEEILKDIQHCKTKEQCEHEIKSLLQEAEDELHRQEQKMEELYRQGEPTP